MKFQQIDFAVSKVKFSALGPFLDAGIPRKPARLENILKYVIVIKRDDDEIVMTTVSLNQRIEIRQIGPNAILVPEKFSKIANRQIL